MDRKKTILIAVLINAGLLTILFIASLVSEKEGDLASGLPRDALSSRGGPLFSEAIDLALQQSVTSSKEIVAPPLLETMHERSETNVLPAAPSSKEALVHKLPPLAPGPVAQLADKVESASRAPIDSATLSASQSTPTSSERREPPFLEIVVKQGDTLDKLAKAHHLTTEEVVKINHLPNSFLRVGQVLKLPAGASTSTGFEAEYYTVKVGDNPWTIAMKHHLKVEELLKMNHLNEEKARKLKPGDRLKIK